MWFGFTVLHMGCTIGLHNGGYVNVVTMRIPAVRGRAVFFLTGGHSGGV